MAKDGTRTARRLMFIAPIIAFVIAPIIAFVIAAMIPILVSAAGRDTDDTYIIDVGPSGFSPASCILNRRDAVRFRNSGSTPRRVIVPAVFANDIPLFDTGLMQPGEVSGNYFIFLAPVSQQFYDAADMTHKFLVTTPVFVEKWDEVCLGDPNPPKSPSPVATASPSPSVSATASPSPSATPTPGRCGSYAACVTTANLAADR